MKRSSALPPGPSPTEKASSRRAFCRWIASCSAASWAWGDIGRWRPSAAAADDARPSPAASHVDDLPATGPPVAGLASFDRRLRQFMRRWTIPGGALAVMKDGRLVLARGYGWADVDARVPVEPRCLFRVASLSKPVTAVAVLRLVEQGRLKLDAPVSHYVAALDPRGNQGQADPRLARVTVQHLLTHTGGWDSKATFDPMFRSRQIAQAGGSEPPASIAAIIRYMAARRLDADPGERFAYSNFGYCLLGRVIEAVANVSYDEAVSRLVLRPAGIEQMRLGRTLPEHRADGEVRYYHAADGRAVSVFGRQERPAPWPYGGFCIEAMDAHGGWIASAVDLLRLAAAIEGRRGEGLLEPATRAAMTAPPTPTNEPTYYGLGWNVRPAGGGANWWHTGSLPGTAALLVRTYHGLAWAVLFNSRPEGANSTEYRTELDRLLWQAAGEVRHWPDEDLFDEPVCGAGSG